MDARVYAARTAAALKQANKRLEDDAAFYADVVEHFSAAP